MYPTERQNGNALFLILIAVVLFAALAFAVTKSENGNANNTKDDLLEIEYSKYANILNLAGTEYTKLRIKGCKANEIDFDGGNTFKPGCALFSKNGGGVPYPSYSNHVTEPFYLLPWTGRVSGLGTLDGPELFIGLVIQNFDALTKNLCTYFNKKNGIIYTFTMSEDVFETFGGGGYEPADHIGSFTLFPGAFDGQHQMCLPDNAYNGFVFYQVIEEN